MNCSSLKEIIKRHRNQIPCRNVILEKKKKKAMEHIITETTEEI